MWQRNFREYAGLTYRKRYKCPYCNEFTLHIEHDYYAECEDGCADISEERLIASIIKKDNYCGYYTLKEVEENFINISDEVNSIIAEISKGTKHNSKFSNKQVSRLNKYFENSAYIDELLDDYVIEYSRKFPDREDRNKITELNEPEYLVNLIEDCHFFVNKALNEIVVYEYGVQNYDSKRTYSGRFFLNNAIMHIICSWERLINALSITYDIEYDKNDMKNNNFSKLHEKLRKQVEFRNTETFKIMNTLKEKGIFGKIDNSRKSNDHDISEHFNMLKSLDKEKAQDPNYNFDLELMPFCNDLLDNAEAIHLILKELLGTLERIILFEAKEVYVYELLKSNYNTDFEKLISEINNLTPLTQEKELKKLYEDVKQLLDVICIQMQFFRKNNYEIQKPYVLELYKYFVDVIFRLHEVSRCLIDVGNCVNGTINQIYPFPDFIINQQYFVYASAYRTYASYDKIGKIIAKFYDIKGLPKHYYFNEVIAKVQEGNILTDIRSIKIAKDLVNSADYKELSDYRNSIFHFVRPGAINGKSGIEVHEQKIVYLAYRNCYNILMLLEQLNKEFVKSNC